MNVKERASDMNGKGYRVHIITYCTNCVFYVCVWGRKPHQKRQKVEGWLERRCKCCAGDESEEWVWRRLTEVCSCLQINSECKLPNLAVSLNLKQSFHRCTRHTLIIKTQTYVSFPPRFPWLVNSYRAPEPYKRERKKEKKKRNGRGQMGSNRFMPTQVQFWHASLAFWWHWNITRAGA